MRFHEEGKGWKLPGLLYSGLNDQFLAREDTKVSAAVRDLLNTSVYTEVEREHGSTPLTSKCNLKKERKTEIITRSDSVKKEAPEPITSARPLKITTSEDIFS